MSSASSSVSDSTSEASQPTPDQDISSLPQVTQWLENLEINDMSTTGSTRGVTTANKGPRIGSPIEFTGNRAQVDNFVLQCRLVFAMDGPSYDTNKKRVLYVISYMKGAAFDWINPHLQDFLENDNYEGRKASTRAVTDTADHLFTELKATFGYGNKQQETERAIQNIRQQGPAAKYKAEFQILVAKLD